MGRGTRSYNPAMCRSRAAELPEPVAWDDLIEIDLARVLVGVVAFSAVIFASPFESIALFRVGVALIGWKPAPNPLAMTNKSGVAPSAAMV